MRVTGEDSGGHLLPTRCEKSGTAWFGCGDWRGGRSFSLYLVYDTVDRRHNIRVYREKLRVDAGGLG